MQLSGTSNNDNDFREIDSEASLLFPKVGIMFNAFSKGKGNDSDSDYVPSDDETTEHSDARAGSSSTSANTTPDVSPVKNVPVNKWICAQSSKAPQRMNVNEHITAKLEVHKPS